MVPKKYTSKRINPLRELEFVELLAGLMKSKSASYIAEFYNRTYNKWYFTAYSVVKDKEVAKDTIHDIYLQLFLEWEASGFRSIGKLLRHPNLNAYFGQIVRNKSRDFWRKKKPIEKHQKRVREIRRDSIEFVSSLDEEDVEKVINLIPNPIYKEIIQLLLKNCSNHYIAFLLKKDATWVKTCKYRAKNQLKKILIEHGYMPGEK